MELFKPAVREMMHRDVGGGRSAHQTSLSIGDGTETYISQILTLWRGGGSDRGVLALNPCNFCLPRQGTKHVCSLNQTSGLDWAGLGCKQPQRHVSLFFQSIHRPLQVHT